MKLKKLAIAFVKAVAVVLILAMTVGGIIGLGTFAAEYPKTFFGLIGSILFVMVWHDAYTTGSDE